MAAAKGHAPFPGAGRPKGSPNKTTKALKDAILEALELAGNDVDAKTGGSVAYLRKLATDHPQAFTGLLGRVLPLQIAGDKDNPLRTVTEIREIIVDPKDA